MAKKKNARKKYLSHELTRLVEYSVTGGAWFWSGYIMFAFLYSGLKLNIVPAKIAAYLFGLTVNFLLERAWVFRDKRTRKQLETVTTRYILLAILNLAIDTGIVWSLSKGGVTPYVGQFVSAGFFTVWNYIWYKLWVFAKGKSPGPKRAAAPHLHRPKRVRLSGARV